MKADAQYNVMVKLWYPEERLVTGYYVMTRHADAVSNGDIEHGTTDLRQAIRDLEDLGHISVEWPLR